MASNWAKYCVEANKGTTSEEFYAAYEMQAEMARSFGPILDDCYAFVCPTLSHHEIPADQYPWDDLFINGKKVDPLYGWCMCHPFNMLGRCPVLSVPSGIGDNGLPTSVTDRRASFGRRAGVSRRPGIGASQPLVDTCRQPAFHLISLAF